MRLNVGHALACALCLLSACAKQEAKFSEASSAPAAMEEAKSAPSEPMAEMAEAEPEAGEMAPAKKEASGGAGIESPSTGADDVAPGKGGESGKKKKKASTWKRSTIVAHTSRLMIGDRKELPIRGMETRVRIDGFRARVLVDYYFHNPDPQQYEGNFTVRLPSGASPYFLAFGQSKYELAAKRRPIATKGKYDQVGFAPDEVMMRREADWIEPKQARVVPKEQAAFAFTETVRRRVDPALMEWAGPGMFNAKIFPIAPNKLHRVVIGYDANLTAVGDGYEFQIPLPEGIEESDVHIAVSEVGSKVSISPPTAADATPSATYFNYSNPADRLIKVRLAGQSTPTLGGSDELGPYFATQFVPELPKSAEVGGNPDALFLVDTSLSANPDRFNVYLKLLRAVLTRNRGTLKRFAVVFFNIESLMHEKVWMPNTEANVAALEGFAQKLALEGATDIGQAFDHALRSGLLKSGQADIFLLSDGAVTWGDGDPYALTNRLRDSSSAVFAYRTGMTGEAVSMLDHFARETGGAVFSVVGESEIDKAATAHTARPWVLRSVSAQGGSDVLLAGRPKTLFPGQRLTAVGRGALSGPLVLELAQGTKTESVSIALPEAKQSPLAARAYGQIAVGQLEEFLGSTQKFAEAYARQYRVPGKSSSLLMLESEADYQRYGIVPKDDLAVVRDNLVHDKVLHALDELIKKLGDPKAAFMAWVERARTMPGVNLGLSAPFARVLEGLPAESFVVEQSSLRAERHDKKSVGGALSEQLAIQKPEYDTVVAEAERRRKEHGNADALKALSSLVEAKPGDGVLARDVGYSAALWGFPRQAYHLFRRVAESRPFEPQTYHAMANTLAASAQPDLAMVYYEVALAGQWHPRFGAFRQIVELDYIGFLQKQSASDFSPSARTYAATRRAALARSVGVESADVVVIISWNTDRTDIDLHVREPSGEECYYSNRSTKSGGELTQDVTEGYGPEMYVLKKAPTGKYDVRVKYYSSDRMRAGTRTKVNATVIQDWGKKQERVTRKVVTLQDTQDLQPILVFKR